MNPDEIRQETKILLRQGHKRVLMVAGEAYPGSDMIMYGTVRKRMAAAFAG